jgi:hypothetical protein
VTVVSLGPAMGDLGSLWKSIEDANGE